MSEHICLTCRFFEREDEHAMDEGNCHRYPPQCQWNDGEMVVMWPVVDWADWCGEYQQQK